MNIKKLSLVVAGALAIQGCSMFQDTVKNADLTPETDSIKPKPVSVVFHRPDTMMSLEFDDNGSFVAIKSTGTAPIHGNNAPSIEEAAKVATNRSYSGLAIFIKQDVTSTRSTKVLSTAVQKSLEDTTNGMSQQDFSRTLDDRDFDADGNPLINSDSDADVTTIPYGNPNTNSQKIAEINRENISIISQSFLKGVACNGGEIDHEARTIIVTCETGVKNIQAAERLAEMTGN
jgi:rhodanese-related sulfurtransferase